MKVCDLHVINFFFVKSKTKKTRKNLGGKVKKISKSGQPPTSSDFRHACKKGKKKHLKLS